MLVVVTGDGPEVKGRGRRSRTFRYLGRSAADRGLPVFLTTPVQFRLPSSADRPFDIQSTDGWLYERKSDRFVRQRRRLDPARVVIYDAMYLDDLTRHKTSYQRLYRGWVKYGFRFFNPVLPSKDFIYRLLTTHRIHPAVLPETWLGVSPESVLSILEKEKRLWIKPVIGSGGRNIAIVERVDDDVYHVVGERFFGQSLDRRVNRRELRLFLRDAMKRRAYMAQKEIPLLRTQKGRKIDFRATVVRFGRDDWKTIAVTARIGADGSNLTNFHAGGRAHSVTRSSLSEEDLPHTDLHELLVKIRHGAVQVASVLQKRNRTLGLLGVDVGVSTDGQIYVYDFNGRPGRDILKDDEVQRAMDGVVAHSRFLLGSMPTRRKRSEKSEEVNAGYGPVSKPTHNPTEPRAGARVTGISFPRLMLRARKHER